MNPPLPPNPYGEAETGEQHQQTNGDEEYHEQEMNQYSFNPD